MTKQIPRIIIGRLPLYLRALNRLKKEGYHYASSRELGKLLDISAAQIRKDLSHFGELGKRGKGYEIEFLVSKLNQILNTDMLWDMIVIGAGDLGSGLAVERRWPYLASDVSGSATEGLLLHCAPSSNGR